MPYRDAKQALRELTSLASSQGGYFTARQARSVGYDTPHLHYHASVGNFERRGHGIYRLPLLPLSQNDDLIRLNWWSRDANDMPQAVVSHESAALIHELGDVLPTKVHLTVPGSFRKPAPKGCVLHRATLLHHEVDEHEGYRITTPLRTVLDLAASSLSQEELDKITNEGIRRGMFTRREVGKQLRQSGLWHTPVHITRQQPKRV